VLQCSDECDMGLQCAPSGIVRDGPDVVGRVPVVVLVKVTDAIRVMTSAGAEDKLAEACGEYRQTEI